MEQVLPVKKRIESIDIVRGLAMVIMALDHVRDYFHIAANIDDPLNLDTASPGLFFTRWVTHFCAPVFVLLSGTSIYLQSLRKTKKQLSVFLIKRGLWLILAEFTIISLAWTFDPLFHVHPMQVIWAIGISMVILGFLIHLPVKIIFVLGVLIVAGHNLLDIPESAPGFTPGFWWDLFHTGYFKLYSYAPGHFVIMVYPFLAWTGVMMLGYCLGVFFSGKYTVPERIKILRWLGFGLLGLFVLLRFINVYGDPHPWSEQQDGLYTFFSFIKINKYPPSLLYLCIMIGPALLLVSMVEHVKNRFADVLIVFGRTAFFYYIIHLYLIHLLKAADFFIKGNHTVQEALQSMTTLPFLFVMPGEGYGLAVVYGIWIAVVGLLYPICKWYDRYKTSHKEKWWLSYL